MPQHVSTKKWIKIWFTTKPAIFIPTLNEERLLDFLETNPNRILTVVYSAKLLNDNGREDFNRLQLRIAEKKLSAGIHFLDFDSHDFNSTLCSDTEKILYFLARYELQHLNEGGNPAAASDMTRLLYPCYHAKVYTDWDIYVAPSKDIPVLDEILVTQELTYRIDIDPNEPTYAEPNNDIFLVNPSNADTHQLLKLQQQIIKNYADAQASRKKIMAIARETIGDQPILRDIESELDALFAKKPSIATASPKLFQATLTESAKQIVQMRKYLLEKLADTSHDKETAEIIKYILAESVVRITGPRLYPRRRINNYANTELAKVIFHELNLPDNAPSHLYTRQSDSAWLPDDNMNKKTTLTFQAK